MAAVIAPLARKAKGNPIGKNDQKLFQPMERVHEALMTSQQVRVWCCLLIAVCYLLCVFAVCYLLCVFAVCVGVPVSGCVFL